jgi:nicotinate-nucleotide--dimethylbenzimidazole phosphoribosyltransferase
MSKALPTHATRAATASVAALPFSFAPLSRVAGVDSSRRKAVQSVIDNKTKPPGSLGAIEALALDIALIQRSDSPSIQSPALIVFAGDHGVAGQGVSPYPQSVTTQMVANFVTGGAAINAFCRASNVHCEIVDVGVAHALPEGLDLNAEPARSLLTREPVALGTADFSYGPAMSLQQLQLAMEAGARAVEKQAARGCNTIGFGEVGIGNTSAGACLMQRFMGLPIADCVGRGTGLDDEGLARKRAVLAAALDRHQASLDAIADPIEKAAHTLAAFGGFEIAAMTGAFLAAAARGMTIVVDGFVVSSALLAACALAPATRDYCVFSHQSEERGHQAMLAHFKASPLLHLGLRLGEGTGAALAMPLLRAACAMLTDMASFASAGVDDRNA